MSGTDEHGSIEQSAVVRRRLLLFILINAVCVIFPFVLALEYEILSNKTVAVFSTFILVENFLVFAVLLMLRRCCYCGERLVSVVPNVSCVICEKPNPFWGPAENRKQPGGSNQGREYDRGGSDDPWMS